MAQIKFAGLEKLQATMRQIRSNATKEFGAALYQEAQIEMTEAKRRVPVDTGTLRASGRVSIPEGEGKNVRVVMSFGGPAEKYAYIVHEDLEAFHKVGQAKYLESVIMESAPHMAARVGRRIDLKRMKG